MAEFQILGNSIAPMLGRAAITDRIWRALTKQSPDNLMVVGPRYIGKTVLLNHLAEKVRAGGTTFRFVVHWHLGRECPKDNEAFFKRFCTELLESLSTDEQTKEYYGKDLETGTFEDLRDVMEDLSESGTPVLMLWDMLDSPLSQPDITSDLWGMVRSLFYGKAHRIVTSSRKLPSELVRDVATEESPFWNIFDLNAVRLLPFDEADQAAVLSTVTSHNFSAGARTELQNFTGGVPVLYLAMLNQLMTTHGPGEISDKRVREAEEGTLDGAAGRLQKDLWRGCSESAKNLYHEICAISGGVDQKSVAREDRDLLLENGFAARNGNKLIGACRLLQSRVSESAADRLALSRLFKGPEEYENSIKGLLELRSALVPDSMARVKQFLRRGISDLPDAPDVCLSSVRGIVDACLDLIFEKELGKPPVIPQQWFNDWASAGERGPEQNWIQQFPSKRGHQVRLLKLMTGTQSSAAKARYVSRATATLMDSAHGFGDLGQHTDGVRITAGVAAVAMMTCIELALRLQEELG